MKSKGKGLARMPKTRKVLFESTLKENQIN